MSASDLIQGSCLVDMNLLEDKNPKFLFKYFAKTR